MNQNRRLSSSLINNINNNLPPFPEFSSYFDSHISSSSSSAPVAEQQLNNSSSSNNNNNNTTPTKQQQTTTPSPLLSLFATRPSSSNSSVSSSNNGSGSGSGGGGMGLPPKIGGGAAKCPLCIKNKQTCEENKVLSLKTQVSNPFIKSYNVSFANKLGKNRKKIKIKEFNSSMRVIFQDFMKILNERQTNFKSEEEYIVFIKKHYYDPLHELITSSAVHNDNISDSDDSDNDNSFFVSSRVIMSDDSISSDDEYSGSTCTSSSSSSSSSTDEDNNNDEQQYNKRKKHPPMRPTLGAKKPRGDLLTNTTTSSSSSNTTTNGSSSAFSSSSSDNSAAVHILAQKENGDNEMVELCLLNLTTDFETPEKFKQAIRQELDYDANKEFKIYFMHEKLGKAFIVANKSALDSLKSQAMAHKPVMYERIVLKLL